MNALTTISIGIVGAAGRGGSFRSAFEANGARITAVCDLRKDKLDECRRTLGAAEAYTDYLEMLDKAPIDAVVIGTPMQLHVPQSIEALTRGKHVLCEVPAAVSIDECRELVSAAAASKAIYMMAENYTYIKSNVFVRALAAAGLFGTVYYAEGEYLHELKELNEVTKWRRHWQTGIPGVTYCTHSLGPILQWMPGDRVTRVCCEDTTFRYRDRRDEPYGQTTPVMLCKTAKGALIKIRVDMLSNRPHAMTNYQLQGSDGCYESARGGPGDVHKICLRELDHEMHWHDLDAVMQTVFGQLLDAAWRTPPEEAKRAGHGGGDYFEVLDFLSAVRGETPCRIGIHDAMDMTLPGLVSQQSATQDGAWLNVPDSRQWLQNPPRRQLHMLWPERLRDTPPVPRVADGYELRQLADGEEDAYIALVKKADLASFTREQVEGIKRSVLPGGLFVIAHRATGALVATSIAQHRATELHPHGGEVGWIAADPEHKGKGLGLAVTAAATARFIAAGYRRIYLSTDDFRLPAIAVYLKLGFEPLMYAPDMADRWAAVRAQLSR
ncbi:GNAT family N-acetyltransferase [bacterium]|nr:GNAT family N-acetyltransferase [bacterium]